VRSTQDDASTAARNCGVGRAAKDDTSASVGGKCGSNRRDGSEAEKEATGPSQAEAAEAQAAAEEEEQGPPTPTPKAASDTASDTGTNAAATTECKV
jgi:hypothetical protein